MQRKILFASTLAFFLVPLAQAADLLTVYQDAVVQDAELAVGRAQLEQSRAQARQSTAALLPQINLTANYSDVEMEGGQGNPDRSVDNLNVTLTAEQMLFNGQSWFNRKAATEQLNAAEATYRDAEQNLLLRVAEAYFNVLLAEDNLRTAQAEEEAIKRQLDQAQEQYDVGLIAITNVLEARAAYDSARAARLGAEGALIISYEGLEQITGQRYEELHRLAAQLPVELPQPNDRQAWVDQALASSQTLQAANAQLRAAERSLTARRSGHLPTLALYGQYSEDSDLTNQVGGDNTLTVGVRASLNIYGGGLTSAQVREGSANLEAARSSEELARRQVLQQTRSLFTAVSTDVLTVQARALAIESAQSALEATRTGYEVGTRNIVDVLNAERSLWAARRDYASARYNYVLNQLRLKRAAGVLAEADLQQLNQWLVASQ